MSDADPWEAIARMAFWKAFTCLLAEAEATADPIADTIYWGHDVDAEQVEAMRQAVFDLDYATEEVLARLCEETEPWSDDADRTPSWLPAEPSPDTDDE
jgi:hypothetical protein